MIEPTAASQWNYWTSFTYAVRNAPRHLRAWLAQRLLRAIVLLVGTGNLIAHAKRELAPSLASGEDGPNRWMAANLIELLAVFSTQGHSGFSASWCISSFEQLANFKPLGPLTGAASEWMEVGPGVFQNNRCSHVFKQSDRFDGQPYDIYGKVFREPNGACFTSGASHIPITFPYTPKSEYVDVPASEG